MSKKPRPLTVSVRPTNWRCPACSGRVVVEVSEQTTSKTVVDGVDDNGELILGSHAIVEPGRPARYECAACERQLTDGGSPLIGRRTLALFLMRG